VRWVGCSNFGKQDLKALLQVGRVEVNQLAYSLLFRAIEYEIAPVCMENHVSIAAYSPLLHGILTGKFASLDEIPDARARTRHFSSARRPLTRHGEPGAEAETAEALRRIRDICDQAGRWLWLGFWRNRVWRRWWLEHVDRSRCVPTRRPRRSGFPGMC